MAILRLETMWSPAALLQCQAVPVIKPAAMPIRFVYRLVARLLHHWVAYVALDMVWWYINIVWFQCRSSPQLLVPSTSINPVMSPGVQDYFPPGFFSASSIPISHQFTSTILAGENPPWFQWISWRENLRKPSIFPWNIGLSCNFPLNQSIDDFIISSRGPMSTPPWPCCRPPRCAPFRWWRSERQKSDPAEDGSGARCWCCSCGNLQH